MTGTQLDVVPAGPAEIRSALLAVPVFEDESEPGGAAAAFDAAFAGGVARVVERGDFAGRKDETCVLYAPDATAPVERLLLVGLGRREDFTLDRLRRAVGTAVRQAERLRVGALGLWLAATERVGEQVGPRRAARAAAEAAVLAAWDFQEYKTVDAASRRVPVTAITLFAGDAERAAAFTTGAAEGRIAGEAANVARGLAIRPGNEATPTYLAEAATTLAARSGLKATVLDREALEREGFHALLAVARGSEQEPRFIIVEYKGAAPETAPLVLVGKGVTFDTGGISIKPADRMEEMKYDMSGAAAVLGAIDGIARLGLRANVTALVPAVENMPSGRAYKPGDVIGSHLGRTIEVVNTDAEGRLILADALSWARRYAPAAVVDAATLTGAVGIALGHHAIAVLGNDDGLIEELRAAGQRSGERCWPLPLWDEYREQIDSTIADIRNSGGRPAGTITAAWFLKEFAGDAPWAHLDIAATAYRDEPVPFLRKGPTGVPTRLLIEWVRGRTRG
jgi:leucyl aminopeptidase